MKYGIKIIKYKINLRFKLFNAKLYFVLEKFYPRDYKKKTHKLILQSCIAVYDYREKMMSVYKHFKKPIHSLFRSEYKIKRILVGKL